jgi:hypothetical protein
MTLPLDVRNFTIRTLEFGLPASLSRELAIVFDDLLRQEGSSARK